MRLMKILTTAAAALSLFVAACSSTGAATTSGAAVEIATPAAMIAAATSATTPTAAQAATVTTAQTGMAPAATATTAPITATSAAQGVASGIRYDVVADGTTADYRVREQLVRLSAPSDAVGTTSGVTGSLVLGSDGKVDASQSKFTVDLTSLQSDSSMRDGFIARSTLNTATYPTAVFVPTALQGLPSVLPTSGSQSFQLIGNLTLHGVTKPVTWTVTSAVAGNDLTGKATTAFKFEDFGMTAPKAGAVLSVVDNVTLELSFHLVKSA
jgi:polyisoprenoid-binding protein YceI